MLSQIFLHTLPTPEITRQATGNHAMIIPMDNPATSPPPAHATQPGQSPSVPNQSPIISGSNVPSTPGNQPSRHSSGIRTLLSVVAFVAGIVVAATLINQFIFQSYYVDGTSMIPTLQNDDRLIIDKVERTVSMIQGKPYIPKRGQVVVLNSSLVGLHGHGEQLIKRVIGLPGETVNISSDGVVIIKNTEHPGGFNVDDSLGLKLETTYIDSSVNLVVPENSVFVMGDNRGPGGSFDSRAFGPIDSSKIEGRLLARIFPLNKTGFF